MKSCLSRSTLEVIVTVFTTTAKATIVVVIAIATVVVTNGAKAFDRSMISWYSFTCQYCFGSTSLDRPSISVQ